jgi:ADP-ribose pyrophosphatase
MSIPDLPPAEIVWQGKYITVRKQANWEYVGRARGITAAVILAIDDGNVILVEQYRVPLKGFCLELPAGLVGDDRAGEAIEAAAARELEEETGYRPGRVEVIGSFASSAGMVSETFTLVRAHDLIRVGEGGGVDHEAIVTHRVPLDRIDDFVRAKRAEGCFMDVKLLTLLGAGDSGKLIGDRVPFLATSAEVRTVLRQDQYERNRGAGCSAVPVELAPGQRTGARAEGRSQATIAAPRDGIAEQAAGNRADDRPARAAAAALAIGRGLRRTITGVSIVAGRGGQRGCLAGVATAPRRRLRPGRRESARKGCSHHRQPNPMHRHSPGTRRTGR